MRLKSLRLVGFKSFADRADFHFPDGITCIVGPNGCGKSNVVDALKWVLGEQRPGALRGSEMADLIFGGTATRKPVGLAEVTMVLDNSNGSVPVEYSEIEVTRRLYRDGTSEYLLNRAQCRLRDLRELLMDTGSGPGAMSVMEQGKIDQILKESVDERRAVFEEAAGIAKYKARRKEALRKLERVEADLLRVTDVVAEKERLVRSLKIQAGRAERYQALVDEMRGKRLVLALHKYGQLIEERGAAAARVADLATAEETARDGVRAALADSRRVEEELESRRQLISAKEQETSSLQNQADTAREKSAFAARLASELDGKIRWYIGEIESSASRLEELAGVRDEVENARVAADAERIERRQAVADAEKGIEAARTAAHERRAGAQKLAERAYENLSRQSRLGSLRSKLDAEALGLADRDARLKRRLATLEDEVAKARQRLETSESEAKTASLSREDAAAALAAGEQRIVEFETKLRGLRDAVGTIDREVSATRSRVDVLRSLEARMEGVGDGPRRYLEAAKKGDSALPKVRGILAELVETDAAAATDVETALGPYAQALVVDTMDEAERAVRAVRDRKLPRCVFLPLDTVRSAVAAAASAAPRLLDAVRCAEDVRPAVAALLADTVPAPDFAAARSARDANPHLRVVLSDGTLIDSIGAVSGGGAAGGAGILQRRTELRDLSSKLEEALVRLDAARSELSATESSLGDARKDVARSRETLRTADAAFHRAKSDTDRARADTQRLAGERSHIEREAAEIEIEVARVRDAAAKAQDESERIAAEQAETEAARVDAAKKLDHAEHALRAAEDRRSDARVHLASVSERCASLDARAQAVLREIGDLEETVRDAKSELSECEKRKADAEEKGREAQKAFEQAHKRREVCVQELAVLRHEASASHSALDQRRSLLAGLEAEAQKVSHELHRFRMQENEARLRVENLIERARDELQADLSQAWEERRAQAPDAAGPGPVYAATASPTPSELEALETEVADLRARIEKMGAVNLEALTQLQDADREATSLRTQHDDLVRSRESLLQAIKKIDQESRVLFEETFQKVRANFQEMFRRLFGGGKADVFLTEGQDVLEAGIEVIAKPPGKEQRSISLLSGGERTMTAVALLFAIYMAKPSPFCLMDEVDAALDENNVDRFVGVLREFSQQSQFLIVSHNKRTISAAGTIFGVSMPEPGVSKKIAVRLDDIADDGQLAPAALAG